MVFSSLIFIFLFLPVQLLVYYLVPSKYKNHVLLIFSLIFYGWSGPGYILILAFESWISYMTAKVINKNENKKKWYLCLDLVVLLAVLIFFKYLSLGAECINTLLGLAKINYSLNALDIALPIGISFYTFQLISYVVDVYRGQVKANESFFKVFLYAGLFHQCIAGPIVRYETIAKAIDERTTDYNDIYYGVFRFSIGLAKKAVLANSVAKVADSMLPTNLESLRLQSVSALWIGAIFYMLQIYLDFSAYSDMAIGLGRMIGFKYMENFNYPYIAHSVTDFWRRWHISLSTFFRDYVYIPLGGNRVKAYRHIINLLIVWSLTGLWHGASANFVLWGLYYFVFLVIEKYVFGKIGKHLDDTNTSKILKQVTMTTGHILTPFIVLIGWVIFRFDSFEMLEAAFIGLLGLNGNILLDLNTRTELLNNIFILLVSIIASTPLTKVVYHKIKLIDNKGIKAVVSVFEMLAPAILIILSAFALAGNSYNPFIYYRF